jgi:ABC-type sugar transport system substrate-binding protein
MMKKLISLLMLVVLVLALSSCGGKKEDKQITIGFNTNNLTNETMSFMVDVFQKYCKENNINFMLSQDDMDIAKILSNLENFVSAGCDGVIFMNEDPVGVAPTVQMLKEKGLVVISYDEISEDADYSFVCPNYDLGYAIGKMAAEWANEAIDDDEIILGLMSGAFNEATVNRSKGITDGFLENCPKGRVYDTPATMPFDECFYNMLQAEPNIKILSSLADSMVVAAAESWYGDLTGKGIDISEYGVFSTDATDIALNLINKSREGKAIFRGTIDLGLKDVVPLSMITACHKAILGQPTGFDKLSYYNIKYVTAENIDEYKDYFD